MARKRKELPLLEKVEIIDVAAEGKAIAKVNDLVIFVPYVVPGDIVDLQLKRKKSIITRKLKPFTSTSIPIKELSRSVSTTEYVADANGKFCRTKNKLDTNKSRLLTT